MHRRKFENNKFVFFYIFEGDYVIFPNYPNIRGVVTNIIYERIEKYTRPKRRGRRFYYTAGIQYTRPKYHVRLIDVPATRFFYENQLDFPAFD